MSAKRKATSGAEANGASEGPAVKAARVEADAQEQVAVPQVSERDLIDKVCRLPCKPEIVMDVNEARDALDRGLALLHAIDAERYPSTYEDCLKEASKMILAREDVNLHHLLALRIDYFECARNDNRRPVIEVEFKKCSADFYTTSLMHSKSSYHKVILSFLTLKNADHCGDFVRPLGNYKDEKSKSKFLPKTADKCHSARRRMTFPTNFKRFKEAYGEMMTTHPDATIRESLSEIGRILEADTEFMRGEALLQPKWGRLLRFVNPNFYDVKEKASNDRIQAMRGKADLNLTPDELKTVYTLYPALNGLKVTRNDIENLVLTELSMSIDTGSYIYPTSTLVKKEGQDDEFEQTGPNDFTIAVQCKATKPIERFDRASADGTLLDALPFNAPVEDTTPAITAYGLEYKMPKFVDVHGNPTKVIGVGVDKVGKNSIIQWRCYPAATQGPKALSQFASPMQGQILVPRAPSSAQGATVSKYSGSLASLSGACDLEAVGGEHGEVGATNGGVAGEDYDAHADVDMYH